MRFLHIPLPCLKTVKLAKRAVVCALLLHPILALFILLTELGRTNSHHFVRCGNGSSHTLRDASQRTITFALPPFYIRISRFNQILWIQTLWGPIVTPLGGGNQDASPSTSVVSLRCNRNQECAGLVMVARAFSITRVDQRSRSLVSVELWLNFRQITLCWRKRSMKTTNQLKKVHPLA